MARKRPKVNGLNSTSPTTMLTKSKTRTTKRKLRANENFHGKLSHASPVSPNSKITKYFQPQEEEITTKRCSLPLSPKSQPQISATHILRSSPRKLLTQANLNTSVISPNNKSPPSPPQPPSIILGECSPHKITSLSQQPTLPSNDNSSPSSALATLSINSPRSDKSNLPSDITNRRTRRCLNLVQDVKVLPPPNTNTTTQTSKVSQQPPQQRSITEFFPVRRSIRKTKKVVQLEQQKSLEEAVLSNREDGLEVHMFEGKGRGIVTNRKFHRGEFVVEYAGQLITMEVARQREKLYAQDQNTGCYMYYFRHGNNQYCVDATPETDRLGRLVNHSRNGNLCTKTIEINHEPHLVLIAKEDIEAGTEVTYDYGDRSKESLRYHPWLMN